MSLDDTSTEMKGFKKADSEVSITKSSVLNLSIKNNSEQNLKVFETWNFGNSEIGNKYELDGDPTYQIVKKNENPITISKKDGAYTATISSAGEYTIVITNKYKKKLTVTKTFEGLGENEKPSNFKIEISGGDLSTAKLLQLNDSNVIKSSDGNTYTWTVSGLTSGQSYTVTETPGTAPTGYELSKVTVNGTEKTFADEYSATVSYDTDTSVAFTNTYAQAKKILTIEKTVTGSGAVVDKENGYTFSLGITKANGTALTDADKAAIASWNPDVMASGYSDTVTVRPTAVGANGKASVVITLPAGYKYQVKENKSNCEKYTTTIANIDGEETTVSGVEYYGMTTAASLDENATVSFTNTYDIPAPTGVNREILPYVISMGIALAGAAMLLLELQRKRRMSE